MKGECDYGIRSSTYAESEIGWCAGIQSHNNREHPPRTNPDIDPARTPQNYDIIYNDRYAKAVKDTIECFATETKTVRKDAVVTAHLSLPVTSRL